MPLSYPYIYLSYPITIAKVNTYRGRFDTAADEVGFDVIRASGSSRSALYDHDIGSRRYGENGNETCVGELCGSRISEKVFLLSLMRLISMWLHSQLFQAKNSRPNCHWTSLFVSRCSCRRACLQIEKKGGHFRGGEANLNLLLAKISEARSDIIRMMDAVVCETIKPSGEGLGRSKSSRNRESHYLQY